MRGLPGADQAFQPDRRVRGGSRRRSQDETPLGVGPLPVIPVGVLQQGQISAEMSAVRLRSRNLSLNWDCPREARFTVPIRGLFTEKQLRDWGLSGLATVGIGDQPAIIRNGACST